jgi:anti-anti-sigma factor
MTRVEFTVSRDDRPLGTVLAVHGDLDIATVPTLRVQVQDALSAPAQRLYLDLTPTTFIDSTGCRELVRAARGGATAGTPVELVVPPANWRVRRVVDFMQFGTLLPVHDQAPYA